MTRDGTDTMGLATKTWKVIVVTLLALAALTVVIWGVGRLTAPDRALQVHRTGPTPGVEVPGGGSGTGAADSSRVDTVRVLAWNIAHARGDLMQGTLQNFRGGSPETRAARMIRIARVILDADADIVALNEVDFDAAWSDGLDQAEALARGTDYPAWVEQRNFDYRLLLAEFAFGNALLTRLPVEAARSVPLPPHRRIEAALIGSKTAAVVELRTAAGPVAVVPVHLEFRSEDTRLGAVGPLVGLQDDAPPLILAGDFNTGPPGWPGTGATTALGQLLEAGWGSPRAAGDPGPSEWTFPSPDPRRAIDWILAEPPLRILDARVLDGHPELSDHLPVLAVVEVRPQGPVP